MPIRRRSRPQDNHEKIVAPNKEQRKALASKAGKARWNRLAMLPRDQQAVVRNVPMPNRSDDPLRKVTLNLYEADCAWLERTYGRGWTERVRQHIHAEVQKRTEFEPIANRQHRRTLGDLTDDPSSDTRNPNVLRQKRGW